MLEAGGELACEEGCVLYPIRIVSKYLHKSLESNLESTKDSNSTKIECPVMSIQTYTSRQSRFCCQPFFPFQSVSDGIKIPASNVIH